MPAISEYYVDHYTEDYQEVLDLATNNNSYSVRDSDTLQYFALEAYAHDIAVPGIGCPGPRPSTATVTSSVAAETETAVAPSSSGTMLSPSTTVQGSASAVLSVPQVRFPKHWLNIIAERGSRDVTPTKAENCIASKPRQ